VAQASGYADLVASLLDYLENPPLARRAANAISEVGGIRIEDDLEGTAPKDFATGPNDDPNDDNVATDIDDDLPWPNATRVRAWWEKNQSRFQPATRYFLGKPITPDLLQATLQHGNQRQRTAAALELALTEPKQPLANTTL
jgi:uncharacterized protein (TIGR02270 family)